MERISKTQQNFNNKNTNPKKGNSKTNRVLEDSDDDSDASDNDNSNFRVGAGVKSNKKFDIDSHMKTAGVGFKGIGGMPFGGNDSDDDEDDGILIGANQHQMFTKFENKMKKQQLKKEQKDDDDQHTDGQPKIRFPTIFAEASATIPELEQELAKALQKQDKPLAVSAINSILWKLGNEERNKQQRLMYLNRKYELLEELNMKKLQDEVMTEILRLDPTNAKLKLEVIKKHFQNGLIWAGYTEYMRFEALVEYKLFQQSQQEDTQQHQPSEESLKLISELEQLKYTIQIHKPKLSQSDLYNQFRITGSNINGTLGIGSEEAERDERVHVLPQFNMRKLYQIAVADFHTLALASSCNCVDQFKDRCKGEFECNGGSVLFGWGFNMHGQVNGMPSERPVLMPKIVPFFEGRKQVKLIAACRSRSIAVTAENEVYEWGFTGEEGQQFQKLYDLPEDVQEIALGTEFNMFLTKNGNIWMSGEISQEGENVVNTWTGLINLSERMTAQERVKFKKVCCGYSHALLIDESNKVYSFGAGLYGQLGLGVDQLKAKWPMPVTDVNDGGDQVLKIACGSNFSICYTDYGIIYYWGMLVPDNFDGIQWLPNFLTISLPKDLTYEQHMSFALTDIKASFREILACDTAGRIYHCDLNYTQTLKPYSKKLQKQVGSYGHKLYLGRSMHIFMKTLVNPSVCQLLDVDTEMESMNDQNTISIKLLDNYGESHYIDASLTSEQIMKLIPITLIFNTSDNQVITVVASDQRIY
eukprot:403332724